MSNIKFVLDKKVDNMYEFKVLHIEDAFFKKIKKHKIVHIDFNTKKIFYVQSTSWSDCKISNNRFSYYISDYDTKLEKEENGSENKYLILNLNVNKFQIIQTDIKDFDKLFIKAISILSDTFNNSK